MKMRVENTVTRSSEWMGKLRSEMLCNLPRFAQQAINRAGTETWVSRTPKYFAYKCKETSGTCVLKDHM